MRRRTIHAAVGLIVGSSACSAPDTTHNAERPDAAGANWLDLGTDAGLPTASPNQGSSNPSSASAKPRPSTSDTRVPTPDDASSAPFSSADAGDAFTHGNDASTREGETHPSSASPSNDGSAARPASSSDEPTSTLDATSGELDAPALFNGHCASCHGGEGAGKPGEAPEIQHTAADYARWVVRNGRSDGAYLTEMPSFDEFLLPDAQLEAISSYLTQLPKPTTGKTLYLDYCANCHGADATGGSVNRPIVGMSDAFVETVRQGRNLDRVGARNMYMPSWKESQLSDAEIAAIGEHVTLLSD